MKNSWKVTRQADRKYQNKFHIWDKMQEEKLFNIILSKELTWEGLIRDIVYAEGMDPWDIDIVALTDKFVSVIRKMQEFDIQISGKFLLAAAILLRMKADHVIPKVIEEEEEVQVETEVYEKVDFDLEPHIPLPKSRKVTVEELIDALRKALVVNERRKKRYKEREVKVKIPVKKVDIGQKIKELYEKILSFFRKFKTFEIKFSQLIPRRDRKDLIWTFVPLVHLANKGKISLRQEENFGEIYVRKKSED